MIVHNGQYLVPRQRTRSADRQCSLAEFISSGGKASCKIVFRSYIIDETSTTSKNIQDGIQQTMTKLIKAHLVLDWTYKFLQNWHFSNKYNATHATIVESWSLRSNRKFHCNYKNAWLFVRGKHTSSAAMNTWRPKPQSLKQYLEYWHSGFCNLSHWFAFHLFRDTKLLKYHSKCFLLQHKWFSFITHENTTWITIISRTQVTSLNIVPAMGCEATLRY